MRVDVIPSATDDQVEFAEESLIGQDAHAGDGVLAGDVPVDGRSVQSRLLDHTVKSVVRSEGIKDIITIALKVASEIDISVALNMRGPHLVDVGRGDHVKV